MRGNLLLGIVGVINLVSEQNNCLFTQYIHLMEHLFSICRITSRICSRTNFYAAKTNVHGFNVIGEKNANTL